MKKRAFGKLYQELFYIPKHEKLPDKVFRCRMVLSLLMILACAAVMAASTFALFYSEVSTDHSTIAGAYYSVTVDNAENGTFTCPLAFEDKHTFEIEADGTATTGYCKIQVGENIYYTEQIFQGHSLIMTVQAAKGTPIVFTPGWGALSEDTCGNEIIHSATPFTVYTVEPTARLSSIAAHYGVTEEDILIYNNLLAATVAEESTTPLLPVGMELKIPNPDENVEPYKVPYATYIVEPTASLDAISAHYGISLEDILTYNNISEIAVGMELKIPGATTETSYTVSYAVYIMQDGATLDNIALHYSVSVDDILYYNNYPNLTVGNELKIPGVAYDYPAYNYVAPIPDPPAVDDTVSGGDVGTGEQPAEQQSTQEPNDPVVEPTEPTNEDTTVSGSDTTPTEQPTVETPTEDTTPPEETPVTEQPTEETPAPDDTTSDGEDNGGEQPTEDTTSDTVVTE